ncbi:MAG: oxidoreductase [Proteobacteria bacterium]|nr:oxidoreductase [Pseudomonadota bacterium]
MSESAQWVKDLYLGLQILATLSFPKSCDGCGEIFETAEQFKSKTGKNSQKSRILKHFKDDRGQFVVQLFSDCVCGSKLKDFFTNCHELAEMRLKRRQKFEKMLNHLVNAGLEKTTARMELLKTLRGEKSELLEKITSQ